jgi:hypothetical protein
MSPSKYEEGGYPQSYTAKVDNDYAGKYNKAV